MAELPIQIQRPNDSYEQRVTGAALASQMGESAEEIRKIRPPLGMIQLFRPKFGYRVGALGIDDIVHLNDLFTEYDFSGNKSGYQGTSYPSLNQW